MCSLLYINYPLRNYEKAITTKKHHSQYVNLHPPSTGETQKSWTGWGPQWTSTTESHETSLQQGVAREHTGMRFRIQRGSTQSVHKFPSPQLWGPKLSLHSQLHLPEGSPALPVVTLHPPPQPRGHRSNLSLYSLYSLCKASAKLWEL